MHFIRINNDFTYILQEIQEEDYFYIKINFNYFKKREQMKHFHWETVGTGNTNLILLHGWGLNSKIWHFIIQELHTFFKIYLIDLPGFGKNYHLHPMEINCIIQLLHLFMPKDAIWLGWSMSGLIVSKLALTYPDDVLGVITVSSSPCFIAKKKWPGIKKNILKDFQNNLICNYSYTIKNFLYSQNIYTKSTLKDLDILHKILLTQPKPSIHTLKKSLEMLFIVDLRLDLISLKTPLLRIYGSSDTLVPNNIITILDQIWPNTYSIIIQKAAHIPFVSHKKIFCSQILYFTKKILNVC